jgi:hypothetical protein
VEKRHLNAVVPFITFFLIIGFPEETSICCKNIAGNRKQ